MKIHKYLFCAVLTLISVVAFAQNKEPDAHAGSTYGAGVPDEKVYDVYSTKRLVTALEKKPELEQVTVKGTVTGVCPMKGCWITLKTADNTEVFVKMKDYAFFLPMNIVGRDVLVDAKATKKSIPVEELKHYAKDAKKPQAEIDAITRPSTQVRLLASGIKVVN